MARALNDIQAIRFLLEGARICEVIKPCRNKRDYNILARDDTAPSGWTKSGHITAGQFEKIAKNGIIKCDDHSPSRSDKYGNHYLYYRLAFRGGDSCG